MSIKIGINGTASFNALKDLIVGTSDKTKQDINRVEDWNGTIIWQRVTTIELKSSNTSFSLDTRECSKSNADKYWSYTCKPEPYKSSYGDGHIEYYNGTSWITLTENKDYTVRWTNNSGRLPASGETTGTETATGKVWIEGMGKYSGSFSNNFTITYTYVSDVKDITGKCTINLASSSKTLTDTSASYTASESDLTISVSSVKYDYYTTLVKGTDYTLTYEYPADKTYTHTSEDTKDKTVTVKIQGIGKYTGNASTTYNVYHSYVIPVVQVHAIWNDGDTSGASKDTSLHLFTPGGTTVKDIPFKSGETVRGVAFGNNLNVAISNTVCKSFKNGDLADTEYSTGLTNNIGNLCFANGQFFVTDKYLKYGAKSADGKTWSTFGIINDDPGGYHRQSRFLKSGGGYLIACSGASTTGSSVIAKSSDYGSSWTNADQDTIKKPGDDKSGCNILNDACYCNGSFYAISYNGPYIGKLTPSTDTSFSYLQKVGKIYGTTSAVYTYMYGIATNGSKMIAIGYYGETTKTLCAYVTSDNWSTWETYGICTATSTTQYRGITYIGGKFYVLYAKDNTSWQVYSSDDGTSWTQTFSCSHSSNTYYANRII